MWCGDPLRMFILNCEMIMNNQSSLLLIKNKWRLTKGILRHYWMPLLVLFGSIVFGGYYVFTKLNADSDWWNILDQYQQYLYVLVVLGCFLRVFLGKKPVFKINSATALYTYNSSFFKSQLKKKKIFTAFGGSLIAFFISLIVHHLTVDAQTLLDYLKLTLFIQNTFWLAWVFYHKSDKRRWTVLPVFAVMTSLLFVKHSISLLPAAVITVMLTVYDSRYLVLNMTKYVDDLRFWDEIMTAQSQNNYADMLRIAEENRSSTVKGLMLHSLRPTRQTVILSKSLLDFIRMHKQIWALILVLFGAGCSLQSGIFVRLFRIPIDTMSLNVVAALCIMMAFQSLFQASGKHATTFIEKSNTYLMLPYTKWQVLWGYYPTVLLISILFVLILDLICGKLSLWSLVFLLQVCASSGLFLYFKIFPGKIGKVCSTILMLLFYFGVMLHYSF